MQFNYNPAMSQLRSLSLILMASALLGCGASNSGMPASAANESTTESVDELISLASSASGDEQARLLLAAAEFQEDNRPASFNVLDLLQVPVSEINDGELRGRVALLAGNSLLANAEYDALLDLLTALNREAIPAQLLQEIEILIGGAYDSLGDTDAALDAYLTAADLAPMQQDLSNRIWSTLGQLDQSSLAALANNAASYELRGWIELARTYRNNVNSLRSQLDAIEQWQRIWAQHSAVGLLPDALLNLAASWDERPRHIVLLLPIQQAAGAAIQEGLLNAYYEALRTTRELPRITVFDTSSIADIIPLYNQAAAEGADLVIGPLNKAFVNRLHREAELPVPTLALNYADSDLPGPANLFQFGLAPEDEIAQATAIAWELGYKNAALLTPDTPDYARLQTVFTQSWEALGGQLVSRRHFSGDGDYADVVKRLMAIDSSEVRAERLLDLLPRNNLEFVPRRRTDIDFIFLMANPRQGRQIKPTLAFYFAEDVPVFALPSIYDGQNNQSANQDLNGIVFTDAPWILNNDFTSRQQLDNTLRPVQGPLQRLRALGVDSYRLHARLEQFASGALSTIPGATGELTISADRRIHRKLQPAYFSNGLAQPLSVQGGQQAD